MKRTGLVIVAVSMLSAATASAGISVYTDSGTRIVGISNFARFDTIQTRDPLQDYQEDGLRVHINDFAFRDFSPPGFDQSGFYYPNGGHTELVDITKVSGADFDSIDFQVSHGFAGSSIFVWVRVLNNGNVLGDFDFDVQGGTYIGITGAGFDQVLVGAYQNAATRDQHNPANLNAIALDYMRAGIIPAPGALTLLGIAGLCARRRRRA